MAVQKTSLEDQQKELSEPIGTAKQRDKQRAQEDRLELAQKLNPKRAVLVPEVQAALEKVSVARKLDACDEGHTLRPSDAHRTQRSLWANATVEEREDMVCGMVIFDGLVKARDVWAFFGVTKQEFEPYLQTHALSCAALKAKVQRNQMSVFLTRDDQADGKYFLGRQFAGQVQNPAHEDTPSVDENSKSPTIVFTESTGLAPEKRAEFEAAIQSAMAAGKVKKIK
jgi:hypothetical protein